MQTIFEALRESHDRQRDLLKKVSQTLGDSPDRRRLYSELKTELKSHADAEERSLYARMLEEKTSQPVASHSVHEHHEIDDLLEKLDDMSLSNPNWIRTFGELSEKVHHHLKEEEHGTFQVAGKVLSAAEKTALTEVYHDQKALEA
ncbi:MAG: hemerythrin domain-containing protein [Planctomycetota bacterium]